MSLILMVLMLQVTITHSDGAAIANPFIVHYTTQEKCRDCSYVYDIFCPEDPDCGIPMKTVSHYSAFATLEDALKFVNRKNPPPRFVFSKSPIPVVNLPDDAELVAIYSAKMVSLKQIKVGEIEVDEKRTVKVKKDKMEFVPENK